MKKVVIILSVMAFIAGCCGGGQSPKSTENNALVYEAVLVSDSVMVMEDYFFHFNFSLWEFPTITDKDLLNKIYAPANIQADDYSKEGLLAAIRKYQAKEVEEAREAYVADIDGSQLSEYFCNTGVSTQCNVLTVSYERGGYFSGAAHPWYLEMYSVFDLQTNKMLETTDVFKDVNDEQLYAIFTQYLEKYLEGAEYTLEDVKDFLIYADKIPISDNFYFNETEIAFVYNQYEIAPYAVGVIYVIIPFAEIGDYLQPSFSAYLK